VQVHLIDGTFRTGPRARDLIIPPHGYLTLEHAYVLDQPARHRHEVPHVIEVQSSRGLVQCVHSLAGLALDSTESNP